MKNWQRTKVQFLSNLYAHLKERVSNPDKSVSGRKYLGLPICDKESFLIFGLTNSSFHTLFALYKKSKGQRKHVPSIDRIDSKKGYILGNMQFITVGENSSKERLAKWFVIQNAKTKKYYRFSSTVEVGRFLHHKREVKATRKNFYDMKSGIKYINRNKRYARS